MELGKVAQAVQALTTFWDNQQLKFEHGSKEKTERFEKLKGFELPSDFKEFYSLINGMEKLYPNDMDSNGFLIYPIEAINPARNEFKASQMGNINNVFIFCEYMHRSWWYGCDVIDKDNYVIGIIPDKDSFKPICRSLVEFIELYLSDSSVLYDY